MRIDEAHLESLTRELASAEPVDCVDGVDRAEGADPARRSRLSPDARLAYVISLGAINFGSGWFPYMNKRPGRSGYFTVALALEEHFVERGPWSASQLADLSPEDCASVFGQDLAVPQMAELMGHFARALAELGRLLSESYSGQFEALVQASRSSAERLVELLCQMSSFRDVSRYGELRVPFYKRAQLTAADLAEALGPERIGFRDLDLLTAFADNLVPHVLRRAGVLRYAPDLAQRIDAGVPIEAGSEEEVEIRASTVQAVERIAASIRERGGSLPPRRIDALLWNRGQSADLKAHPRHRTRTLYY